MSELGTLCKLRLASALTLTYSLENAVDGGFYDYISSYGWKTGCGVNPRSNPAFRSKKEALN